MTPVLVRFKGERTLTWKKEIYFLFGSNASILISYMSRKVAGCSPPSPRPFPGSGVLAPQVIVNGLPSVRELYQEQEFFNSTIKILMSS